MKKIACFLFISLILSVLVNAQVLNSPDGKFTMTFGLQTDGTPTYMLSFKNKPVIKNSKLGLELKDDKQSLLDNFEIARIDTSSFDETWKPVWGEVTSIRNYYKEMAVSLHQKESDRILIIRFR
ncbi:MAG: glycoside hydrolase family 97 N-terminal domain-containing protein, partial [Ginsengibacter sp.]